MEYQKISKSHQINHLNLEEHIMLIVKSSLKLQC